MALYSQMTTRPYDRQMAATSQVRASPDDRLGYNGTRPLMVLLSGTMLSQGHHLFGPLPPIREELPGLNIIFHHEIYGCATIVEPVSGCPYLPRAARSLVLPIFGEDSLTILEDYDSLDEEVLRSAIPSSRLCYAVYCHSQSLARN